MKYEGQHISSAIKTKSIDLDISKNDNEQKELIKSTQNFYIDEYKDITHDILIERGAPFITLKTTSIERPIKLLLDTGASVSIISTRAIPHNPLFLQNIRYKLHGLGSSDDGILSLGLFHTKVIINGTSLGISLHVVDEKYLGTIDGFLGFDFIMNYKVNIDIGNLKVHFRLKDLLKTDKIDEYNKKTKWNYKKTDENYVECIEKYDEKIMQELNVLMKNYEYNELNQPENTSNDQILEIIEEKITPVSTENELNIDTLRDNKNTIEPSNEN